MTTYIIHNARKTMVGLPAIKPRVALGNEVETEAQLDPDGRVIAPPVLMAPGTVLEDGFDAVNLLPGENTVGIAYWNKVCNKRSVKLLLACEYIKNLGEGKARLLIAALDTLPPDVARLRIQETTSIAVLDGWAEGTESRGMKNLIDDRKQVLIANASGAPVRGAGIKDQKPEDRIFGDDTTERQVHGDGEPAFGAGELERAGAPAPAPAPAPSPAPAPAPSPAPSPAPAPAPKG